MSIIVLCKIAWGLNNGLGLTPPMGFNTWNHFACNINETVIIEAAHAIVDLGLRDLGYIYINIDDCWMDGQRSAQGELVPNRKRFPNGIKVIADYIHQLGLKLGIYSSAGTKTCQFLPASLDYEDTDARSWASWGIDYLKYDNCFHDGRPGTERYIRMRDALNNTGRMIFYSICNWGEENLYEIAKDIGNSWRTTYDISNNFDSMRSIFKKNSKLAKNSGVGGWNDPDMLEIGNGAFSVAESRTHFALWAMAKSPLLIGCDLTKIHTQDLNILKNEEVIALNQDPLGIQATCALNCDSNDFSSSSKKAQIFKSPLEKNEFAISATNWNDHLHMVHIKISFKELGLPLSSYKVRDLFLHKDLGEIKDSFEISSIDPHDTAVFRLSPY